MKSSLVKVGVGVDIRENLIISADDFGKNSASNENILSLVRDKKIDRVAVLMDGEITDAKAAELSNSGAKLDLHLNLKKFKPRPDETRSNFKRIVLFLLYYFLKSNGNIGKEWELQLEKFQKLFGRLPDGLNSHQYIHFFPPYFKIILELDKKYEIPYLRFGKSGIAENINSISGILNWLWKKNNPLFKRFSFDSSDFLASYDWIKDFPKFLSKLPPGKTELIFHPERDAEFETIKKYF